MSAGDLAQLVARLEKVTDRLEKTSVGGGAPAAASAGPAGGMMMCGYRFFLQHSYKNAGRQYLTV